VYKCRFQAEASCRKDFPGIYFQACNICRTLPATPGAGNFPEKTISNVLFTFFGMARYLLLQV
jgi:hypothetical protein